MKLECSRTRMRMVAAGTAMGGSAGVFGAEAGVSLGAVLPQPATLVILLAVALFYFGFRWRTE